MGSFRAPPVLGEKMNISMDSIVQGVIARGAGNKLFGGKKARGPLRTADFVYEVMIGVALELTERLPMFFEECRQSHEKKKKWNKENTKKGLYTDSYGWTPDREFRHDLDIDPVFFNYFNRIITPYLGGAKKRWTNENSKIWKYIKKLIISGDKVKITKLQQSIRNQILRESKNRIFSGPNNSKIITAKS
jgi:hypothetical protein